MLGATRGPDGFAMMRAQLPQGEPAFLFALLLDASAAHRDASALQCTCGSSQSALKSQPTPSRAAAAGPGFSTSASRSPAICFILSRDWEVCWRCTITVSAAAAQPPPFAPHGVGGPEHTSFPVRTLSECSSSACSAMTWKQLLREMVHTVQLQGDVRLEATGGSAITAAFPQLSCEAALARVDCPHTQRLMQLVSTQLSSAYLQLLATHHSDVAAAARGGPGHFDVEIPTLMWPPVDAPPEVSLRLEPAGDNDAVGNAGGADERRHAPHGSSSSSIAGRNLVHPHQRATAGQKRPRGLSFGAKKETKRKLSDPQRHCTYAQKLFFSINHCFLDGPLPRRSFI
eukprot:gene2102-1280_t